MPELPAPSAKTAMNSRNSKLSEYLTAKQNRRKKTIQRRRRLAAGLPAVAPLKRVSLDHKQQEAIASVEAIGTAKRKRPFVTRHFAWPVSLGLHLFAAFLLTLYVVQEYIPESESVSLAFVNPIREPRVIRRRPPIKPAAPAKKLQIQAQRVPRSTPAAVEIPTEEARFYTPEDDLVDAEAGPTAGGVAIPEGLGSIQVEQQRAEIPTEALELKIERSTSIAPEDSEIDISDAGLGGRTIEAEGLVEVEQKPRFLRKVEPKYPEPAKRAALEGVVELEATIGVDGMAKEIKVVKPLGFGCDEAAVEALKKSRFTPAKRGTEAIPKRIRIKFRFTLDD